jgi:hypothetical protein
MMMSYRESDLPDRTRGQEIPTKPMEAPMHQSLLIALIVGLTLLILVLGYGWLFSRKRSPKRKSGLETGRREHVWGAHGLRSRELR